MLKKIFFIATAFSLCLFRMAFAQSHKPFLDFLEEEHTWVDSVYKQLSRKERIAQLFMVRAHTNLGQRYIDSVEKVVRKQKIGGLVFFQGGPLRHAATINQYQAKAKVPLLVAMDGEWGLGMRLMDSTISFPYQMALGAIQDDTLIYQMGQEVARQFKRMGLNVNFAPVVDINNNPNNPVINYRSFGDNKFNVARKGAAYMKGMMDEGLLVTLKHFPGHGDTDVDSHYDLPKLPFSAARLDSLELFPFRELIRQGASGVMIAHMDIPALDPSPNTPSSLSKPVVTSLLKERMGFRGLVFTDAMEMKGVLKYHPKGKGDLEAILAGNDVLELSENSKRGINMIRKALRKHQISEEELNNRVKKVLTAKYWLGLDRWKPALLDGLYEDLHGDHAQVLNQELADAAVTLLKGDTVIRQLKKELPTALISIGLDSTSLFQRELNTSFQHAVSITVPAMASPSEVERVLQQAKGCAQVLVALHDSRLRPQSRLDYSPAVCQLVSQLASIRAIITVFANPYTMDAFPGLERAGALLVAYQNDANFQKSAANVMSGGLSPQGRLPVRVNAFFKYGDGM